MHLYKYKEIIVFKKTGENLQQDLTIPLKEVTPTKWNN